MAGGVGGVGVGVCWDNPRIIEGVFPMENKFTHFSRVPTETTKTGK